jgi:TP901 family phage tail tape measure protein
VSDKKWTLLFEIMAGNQSLVRAMNSSQTSVKKFVNQTKSDFQSISKAWNSTTGKIATLGLGAGAGKMLIDSALLDKTLKRIGRTASASKDQIKTMRNEIFAMANLTGQNPEGLVGGIQSLIASGSSWDQALSIIKAINYAMAESGASGETLAKAMTVTATAFSSFDLTKPEVALEILDKMTVAGRLGNAELENLSDIFARIGVNAKTAGMSYESTLAFIEALSMIEKNPERLSTLADSTLRVFTNMQYLKRFERSGVKLFNIDGSRRDAFAVLEDVKKKYDTMDSDKKRAKFINKILQGADLDTIKGIQTLMSGDLLAQGEKFKEKIKQASGTLKHDLPDSVDDAISQANRLKNILREASEGFTKPINKTLVNVLQYAMDKKGLSGGDIAGLGVAALLTGWVGKRVAGRGLSKIFGSLGTLGGIAEGKAIQAATGVTPVFITNWDGGSAVFSGHGLSGSKWEEYLTFPAKAGAGVGIASIIAVAGPVALGLLAGGTLIAMVMKELEIYNKEKSDAEVQKKLGFNPHLTRDSNAVPRDLYRSSTFSDAMAGKDYKLSDLFYKSEQQSTRNDIRIEMYVDANGKVISKATGKEVNLDTNVKRGSFDAKAVADRMFTGSAN